MIDKFVRENHQSIQSVTMGITTGFVISFNLEIDTLNSTVAVVCLISLLIFFTESFAQSLPSLSNRISKMVTFKNQSISSFLFSIIAVLKYIGAGFSIGSLPVLLDSGVLILLIILPAFFFYLYTYSIQEEIGNKSKHGDSQGLNK